MFQRASQSQSKTAKVSYTSDYAIQDDRAGELLSIVSPRLFFLASMKQIKLKDLHKHCCKLMKEGHGEKSLVLSDDNEGNGYHGCFFTLTVVTPENKDGFIGLIGDNTESDLENIIVVG